MSGDRARGLEIIGGAAGTAARLADLDRCAAALRSGAASLDQAWRALGRIWWTLDEWGTVRLTGPMLPAARLAREARAIVGAVRSGPHGVLALSRSLSESADHVASARGRYAEAESLASKLWLSLGPVVVPGLWHTSQLGFGVADGVESTWRLAEWDLGGDIPADWLEKVVDRVARVSPVASPGLRPLGDDAVPWVAGGLAGLATAPGPREVRALPVIGSRRTATPPRNVTDLVTDLTGLTGPRGAVVEITQLPRADGTSSWVVAIPGTQDWSVGHDDPLDLASNLQAMGGQTADSTRAVLAAMAAAGIGPHEPVVLAGHSQGGLVASQIAALGGYAVGAVLTVGSPTGSSATAATVPTLSLEHESDVVPALDGRAPSDDPRRTTVRGRAPREARRSFSRSHGTREYAELAEQVDASDHESVAHWRETVDELLGDGEAGTTRAYRLQRLETAR